jgi:hypothetical protein
MPHFQVRLDRGSLPSETLKCGALEERESAGGAEEADLKGIIALTHRSNVPLQVFSGETTPILDTGSAPVTQALRDLIMRH